MVHSIMQMEMYILENSTKIELMDMGYMFIQTAKSMKASGKMICKMAREKKNLKMAVNTMECSKMVRNGDRVHINGLIVLFILAIGTTIILKEMVSTLGLMAGSIREHGKIIN